MPKRCHKCKSFEHLYADCPQRPASAAAAPADGDEGEADNGGGNPGDGGDHNDEAGGGSSSEPENTAGDSQSGESPVEAATEDVKEDNVDGDEEVEDSGAVESVS